VGREDALADLRAFLGVARSSGRVALVSVEAGIGKSRVLAAFIGEAVSSGWRALTARFFEWDVCLPYSAVSRLLEGAAGGDVDSSTVLVQRLSCRKVLSDRGQGDIGFGGQGFVVEYANNYCLSISNSREALENSKGSGPGTGRLHDAP